MCQTNFGFGLFVFFLMVVGWFFLFLSYRYSLEIKTNFVDLGGFFAGFCCCFLVDRAMELHGLFIE